MQSGSTTKTLTGCTVSSTGPVTVDITDAFNTGAYSSTGTPFYLNLGGLINPRTTLTTGSFTISTTDSSGNAIESISSGVTTKMNTINPFTVTVTP